MVKDYPNVRIQGKGNSKDQTNGPNFEAPKGIVSTHSRLGVNKHCEGYVTSFLY